ncbi:hypothetical protein [Ottowia sp.]|uniref:hypothetical protein n=1 Tax=Ottowia sp. TaxID=1898956 RepID=UPI002BCFDD27|nr:hypothetical protein [Ottowia sp.]HOB65570.1 hypothetical protein [Ottowia sp.]HPZ56621.1 hypothetical protein [Ottowia sp.]HQD46672.1 hypothetical protein [Ottowia sp.]
MKRPTATRPPAPPATARTVRGTARAPRNPVALALAARRASGAAGRHAPAIGAQRAAARAALIRQWRAGERN